MAGKIRWDTACLLANAGLLGVVVWVCHFGHGVHRLRTAAIFLILGTVASIYCEVLFHVCRMRARRQRERVVPHGVRLRKPLWLAAGGALAVLPLSMPVAALAGGLGSRQTGFGVLLAVAALTVTVGYFATRHSCGSVALHAEGLRLYSPGFTFLVPWRSISSVDVAGQAEWKLVQLTLLEIASAIASVQPATPRARQRAQLTVYTPDGSPGKVLLDQWAAGIDAAVLARAIKAEMTGSGTGRLN